MVDNYTLLITSLSILELISSSVYTSILLYTYPYLFNEPIIYVCVWYGYLGFNVLFLMILCGALLVVIFSCMYGFSEGT